jgi:hypothetical protein
LLVLFVISKAEIDFRANFKFHIGFDPNNPYGIDYSKVKEDADQWGSYTSQPTQGGQGTFEREEMKIRYFLYRLLPRRKQNEPK